MSPTSTDHSRLHEVERQLLRLAHQRRSREVLVSKGLPTLLRSPAPPNYLLRRNPLMRVQRQHALQQRDRLGRMPLNDRVERLRLLRRERRVQLQLRGAWPVGLGRRAQHLVDPAQLVDLVGPREERLLVQDLGEEAAGRPHVAGGVVRLRPQQQFGTPVPQRHHPIRHLLSDAVLVEICGVHSLAGRRHQRAVHAPPGQPKVRDFHNPAVSHKHVRRRQIAVREPVAVQLLQPLEQLPHDALLLRHVQPDLGVHDLLQVARHELHHDVDEALRYEHGDQVHEVRVVQLAHHLQLPQRGEVDSHHADDLALPLPCDIFDLLYGHMPAGPMSVCTVIVCL
ncbi:D-alanyl-D-alanine carboxypeptidase/D-alanyl-D-alanine-endopeptidase [Babesia caballi]|uniref:D-alanyl-D-alanine carboxypeptidase/D-alanyl-D-alanine-endopeptidase n=1 Tax=Babesia caballi TaxID=5871 RepID=A0AAV4LSF3_BABCB|nr:D-alanyl-D-alanine carboxypeptidase/D-alanyl-D-alanine-endopeptidase [Babesia caballi]